MEQVQEKPRDDHVLETPFWFTIVRVVQFVLSVIILGLAGALIHDAYLDQYGFAVATVVLSWVGLAYIVLTEKLPSFRKLYNILGVLVIEGFLTLLWFACWVAAAAKRSKFTHSTTVSSCFDDGSLVSSKTCVKKRDVILFKAGAAMFAAIAGLGALEWLLFVATFSWLMVTFFRQPGLASFRQKFSQNEGQQTTGGNGNGAIPVMATDDYQMQANLEAQQAAQRQEPVDQPPYQQTHYQQPGDHQQQQQQQQQQQYHVGQQSSQGDYTSAQYQQPPIHPQQSVSPYQASGPYEAPETYQGHGQSGQQSPPPQQQTQVHHQPQAYFPPANYNHASNVYTPAHTSSGGGGGGGNSSAPAEMSTN